MDIDKEMTITLKLTEQEASLLMSLAQNPHDGLGPTVVDFAENLFNNLRDVFNG